MPRSEFPKKVRLAAWERCDGHCENCTAKLMPGKFAYDHIVPDGLGGEPVLSNCQVLCDNCHGAKTAGQDVPRIAKADRSKAKHIGAAAPRRKIASRGFAKVEAQHTATRPIIRRSDTP